MGALGDGFLPYCPSEIVIDGEGGGEFYALQGYSCCLGEGVGVD